MLSVNTNAGAMIALQYLNQTQGQLATTQNAINTGLKVATAKDNGAIFAIAQNMRGDVSGYQAVTDSLNRGISTVDVAMSAGQSISDLLIEMKAKALAAADKSSDTPSRQALNEDFTALRDQIKTIVNNAVFNNTNLVKQMTGNIQALVSADGSRAITVSNRNLSLSGSYVTIKSDDTINTLSGALSVVSRIETSLKNVDSALSYLASGSKKLSIQLGFTQKLSDTLTSGIGSLVDADMAKESAQLTALQTKQQLAVQALSIANQAPQVVLSLFK